jgi:hypothetical protein
MRAVTMLSGLETGSPRFDLVDVRHAVDNFAPYRLLAVEPFRFGKADEELAVGGILILRAN